MNEPIILIDCHRKPYYLAAGDYSDLIADAHFKTGLARRLDQSILKVQSFLKIGCKPNAKHLGIINDIQIRIKEPIQGLLLYDTGWYKDCQYIGFIKTYKTTYFLRYFRQPEDILFFEYQNQLIQQYFQGVFSTVPVYLSDGNILLQPHIKKNRDVNKDDHIEDKIIYLVRSLLKKDIIEKDVREILPIDFFLLCAQTEEGKDLPVNVKIWLDKQKNLIPLVPVHGDMTPWNIIVNKQEQAVLIDYERAGWHVPYYDLFHYVLQNSALKNLNVDIIRLLNDWNKTLDISIENNLILYLIDQLHFDLNNKKQYTFSNPHLDQIIRMKIEWLRQLIDHINVNEKTT